MDTDEGGRESGREVQGRERGREVEREGVGGREMSVYLLCFWVGDELNHIPSLKCIHRVVGDLSVSW